MALIDAIEASIARGLDPNANLTRDYIAQLTKEKAEDVNERQLATLSKIRAELKKAEEDKAPQSVIAAYEKMLNRYQ